MSDVVIRVENLGKKYRIRHQQDGQRYVALRDVLADKTRGLARRLWSVIRRPSVRSSPPGRQPAIEDFWALRRVSFEVRRGEVLGIIGRNGAGKSTLLKILSRVTEPTEGRACLRGRVASLLEVGTGFHPELTGRENIFLNGAVLGMTKAEIRRKFDEIVAFAEVEKFLDTPVKRYSSGMYVRLAFAVAAHLEPEILVVDEVLAVGDTAFQRKCMGKMSEVASGGRTALFVSHRLSLVQSLCSRGVYLRDGTVAAIAPVRDAISHYLQDSDAGLNCSWELKAARAGGGGAVVGVDHPRALMSGDRYRATFALALTSRVHAPQLRLTFYSEGGEPLCSFGTHLTRTPIPRTDGPLQLRFEIGSLPLNVGNYWVNFALCDGEDGNVVIHRVERAFALRVEGGDPHGTGRLPRIGALVLPHQWTIVSAQHHE